MGRGLQAILSLSGTSAGAGSEQLRELPLELITPNARQPRERFDDDTLQGLADSLRERGVLQPILVRPKPGGRFELIAGERRWRAARLAGLESIPALVREGADVDALELALIENVAREDLSPIEQARACAALVDELGLTREDVGRRIGRSRVAVSNLLRLLELPEDALDLLHRGVLSEGHGRALLLAEDHGARRALARRAAADAWSVRTTEARARDSNAAHAPKRSGGRARVAAGDAEREHAAHELAEALSEALRAEVHVRATANGGFRAELAFASLAEARELAQRLLADAAESSATRQSASRHAIRSVS
jgi:ParB family chromosome partitioning protein